MPIFGTVHAGVETPYAWLRLTAAVVLSSIGSVGTWSVPVVLAPVQAAFGVARGDASLPFTLAMIGFALGGVVMGKLTDRFGVLAPVLLVRGDDPPEPPAILAAHTSSRSSARRAQVANCSPSARSAR